MRDKSVSRYKDLKEVRREGVNCINVASDNANGEEF
jgi:hypothetical protein